MKPVSTTKTKRFYFDTGIRPKNIASFPYEYHRRMGNVIRGTLLIPFDCNDVPDNAMFQYACDNPNLNNGMLVREIVGGNLLSKYAYFIVPEL